jgi:hypothetical protein
MVALPLLVFVVGREALVVGRDELVVGREEGVKVWWAADS